jgi:hypothetical protein
MERYERHVGIGVDTEVVRFSAEVERRTVLFDFPLSRSGARWNEHFSIAGLERARRACPRARFVGSGEANSPARPYFDDWIPYGAPHPQYVKAFEGCAAFVPGHHESVGLALCEAQVAGAAVVYRRGFVHADVLCSGAGFPYDDDDELVVALDQALAGEGTVIAADAARRFDYSRVVERVRAATGV